MKIYIDSDYKCHITNDGTMREIEDSFFDDKCSEFIEAYRYVPDGETWTRDDGEVFSGCMISPCTDISTVINIQRSYELELLANLREETKNSVSLTEIDEAYREGVNSI